MTRGCGLASGILAGDRGWLPPSLPAAAASPGWSLRPAAWADLRVPTEGSGHEKARGVCSEEHHTAISRRVLAIERTHEAGNKLRACERSQSCLEAGRAGALWGHLQRRGSLGVTSFMFSEGSALPIVSLGHIYKSPKCESHPKGRKGKGSVLAPPQPCCWKFSREHC